VSIVILTTNLSYKILDGNETLDYKDRQSRETGKIGPITYEIIRIKKNYVE
jgi:hypothetical protein